MKLLLAVTALGGLLVLEALRSRRARPIPKPRPLYFWPGGPVRAAALIRITFDDAKFREEMKRLAEAAERVAALFRDFAVTVREATASLEAVVHAVQSGSVGEPEILIDHSKCWRCQSTPVPREDDLGLCGDCTAHLQSL